MMNKYRKKPVVIEAIQWDGTNAKDVVRFADGNATWFFNHNAVTVKTLEGYVNASVGDWIIRGVNGEFYPCKPDIFAKTYEAVLTP